jgi:hypothetical protein
MKTKTTAPATEPNVDDATRLLAERTAELEKIKGDITTSEASLPGLAQAEDDEAFEKASLNIERLRRSELRASTRLGQARMALLDAEDREYQGHRRALFDAGKMAACEAAKLLGTYAGHAEAIAGILREIEKFRDPIETANESLPDGKARIDADHALGINRSVELPALTRDGEGFWYKTDYYGFGPLNPRPPRHPGHILFEGIVMPFDSSNPRHVEARNAKASPTLPRVAPRAAPQDTQKYGEKLMPDGSRRIEFPPNQWPPAPESASKFD